MARLPHAHPATEDDSFSLAEVALAIAVLLAWLAVGIGFALVVGGTT